MKQSGKQDKFEASDFMPEIRGAANTVKFIYTNAMLL